MSALKDLPDYASFERVAQALWAGREPRGAALMVGAGLSRCAVRVSADTAMSPLWIDFSREMAARIYPNSAAPSDALRLAQEFEAALGRGALNDLIRAMVNDEAMLPGPLHKRLVALPWSDILTTNWDTLLERAAAENPDTFYSVVNNVDDIARTHAPRIAKLHGSFPSYLPFIFTEEDFRRYPRDFAPFVNLAQQVVMENALCLVGFSGDDPNFLQWTGWVRDHLGDNAPDIFLVGALSLSPAKRKMLESRRVRPIDFTPMLDGVPDAERHERAMALFIDGLQAAKPWPRHRWPEPPRGAAKLSAEEKKEKLIERWRDTRKAYPGWVVAPSRARRHMQFDNHEWGEFYRGAFKALGEQDKRRALYEYGWRLDTQLTPLPEHLRDLFAAATADDASALLLAQRSEIGRWLLRDARERGDGEAFVRWEEFLEKSGDAASKPWLAWERCLRARDELNLGQLEKLLPALSGEDPMWRMRKAVLLVGLGQESEALTHAHDALRDLRARRARDRVSIWIASRLSWCLFVCQVATRHADFAMPEDGLGDMDADRWPWELTAVRCDPWEERNAIDEALDKLVRGRRSDDADVHYSFDPGYATHHYSLPFPRQRIDEPTITRRFFDAAAVPSVIGHVNLIGDVLELAAEIDGLTNYGEIVRLASLRLKDRRLDEIMNRLIVSRLPQVDVEKAAERLMEALKERIERWSRVPDHQDDWREAQDWSSQASRIAEVLSRVSVRLPLAQIKKLLALTFEIAKESRPRDWTFYKPLAHLLGRALRSLPRDERVHFMLDAIELPLPGEGVHVLSETDWPEVIFHFHEHAIDRNTHKKRWARRIEEIIEVAATGDKLARTRAVQRLSRLHRCNALTPEEASAFAVALWSKRINGKGLPEDTGLYAQIMLLLPEPSEGLAEATFRKEVFTLKENAPPDEGQLIAAFNLVRHLDRPPGFDMDRETARVWLERMSAWKRKRALDQAKAWERPDFSISRYDSALGWALEGAVLPVLAPEDITDEIIEGLFSDDAALTIVRGLPALVRLRPELLGRASDRLRQAFARVEELSWVAAAEAMREWTKLDDAPKAPGDLYSEIASAVLTRHPKSLHSALEAATALVKKNFFSAADLSKLEHGLTYLMTELDYDAEGAADVKHLSLARVASARLAAALQAAGRAAPIIQAWLDAASNDQLPEVRHFKEREIIEEEDE